MMLGAAAFVVTAAGMLAAHPEAKAEWWYYTGHLRTARNAELGFELTFFRAKLADGEDLDAAHFALTDVAGRKFRYAEKLHRPFPGIAFADPERLSVAIENWEAREESGTHRLRASLPGVALSLDLVASKPPVWNGEGGISRKGPRPDEFSHYLSIPRLAVSGTVTRTSFVYQAFAMSVEPTPNAKQPSAPAMHVWESVPQTSWPGSASSSITLLWQIASEPTRRPSR